MLNLIASNKCVNVVTVVCKFVDRMGTFFLDFFWLSVAEGDGHHRETS